MPDSRSAHGPVHGWRRWIPGLATLGEYRRDWLAKDLMAGMVLTAILVPVGMGYAEASGLPAIHGLYATMLPLIAKVPNTEIAMIRGYKIPVGM
jgi:hypothetical protein